MRDLGFDLVFRSYADAILSHSLSDALDELEEELSQIHIRVSDLVAGGGGESSFTQRLRKSLTRLNWKKHEFVVERTVDGRTLTSQSHEIDHVKTFANGTVALEIEWNTKDTFYDRDLENFSRLHVDGAIALGIEVTRGKSLQDKLEHFIERYAERHKISDIDALDRHLDGLDRELTRRQRKKINERVELHKDKQSFEKIWAHSFVADKFGQATTHWSKLQVRIDRGVGNPCPLVGIGIPDRVVIED